MKLKEKNALQSFIARIENLEAHSKNQNSQNEIFEKYCNYQTDFNRSVEAFMRNKEFESKCIGVALTLSITSLVIALLSTDSNK